MNGVKTKAVKIERAHLYLTLAARVEDCRPAITIPCKATEFLSEVVEMLYIPFCVRINSRFRVEFHSLSLQYETARRDVCREVCSGDASCGLGGRRSS